MNNRWILFLLIILFVCAGCENVQNFERSKWIESRDEESWTIRSKMARGLVRKNTLIGKPKQDIIKLLGKPESYSGVPNDQLCYLTNEYYGRDIDPIKIEHLVLYLDANKRVYKVTLMTNNH